MLDKSPLDSLRVRLSAESAMADKSPRNLARILRSVSLNVCMSDFFFIASALLSQFIRKRIQNSCAILARSHDELPEPSRATHSTFDQFVNVLLVPVRRLLAM